jgi:hypothetical protein
MQTRISTFIAIIELLLLMFISAVAAGQASVSQPVAAVSSDEKPGVAPAQKTDPGAKVGLKDVVVTVRGICVPDEKSSSADSCIQTITREQLETLMKALNPEGRPLPPNAIKNLAKTYAEYLAVEAAARKAGIVDSPEIREFLAWIRLKTITEIYRHKMEEKYKDPSQEDLDAYYRDHPKEFERAKLACILVPRKNSSAGDQQEFDKKALAVANTAQARLVEGADPAQVQKDVYSALGLAAPPLTDVGNRRRSELIPDEAEQVFALKAGEVTQVLTEIQNYVIYKVVAKDEIPEEEVKKDISREVFKEKFRTAMQSVVDAAPAEFNPEYFGSTTPVPAAEKAPAAPSATASSPR